MKYKLYMPFVHGQDLMRKALSSITAMNGNIVVIDNSHDGKAKEVAYPYNKEEDVEFYRPPVRLNFTHTMNLMQERAKRDNLDVFFFMHNDAQCESGEDVKFLEKVKDYCDKYKKWGVLFTNYDTLCAFNMKAISEVGPWDTNFAQYFSDNDYYRRLKLAGYPSITLPIKVKHEASSTIKRNHVLGQINGKTFPIFNDMYKAKWGGPTGKEVYDKPYNLDV